MVIDKTVNGFWLGNKFNSIAQTCIESWLNKGYKFNIFTYNTVETDLEVNFLDANLIVDQKEYFTYNHGISRGTPVAFSNLFRAALLYKQGGLYVDLDVYLINPIEINSEYLFAKQNHAVYPFSIGSCFIYSKYPGNKIFLDWYNIINYKKQGFITHGDLGPDLFTELVVSYNLSKYACQSDIVNPIDYTNISDLYTIPKAKHYLHLYNSCWSKEDLKNVYKLKELYG
jgi:mannosyltransferase OCH1-like enzyme|tara:strand:+ start:709 stop:1392 length:684 start_codon:yes stop_codon:yes gene_type:complete